MVLSTLHKYVELSLEPAAARPQNAAWRASSGLPNLVITSILSSWETRLVGTEPGHGADVFPLTDVIVSTKADGHV